MERTLIAALISCKKTIKTAPKKTMLPDPRSELILRNDFSCVSEDGKAFDIFMRKNVKLPYLFSIGLRYRSNDGTFTLCRYNGKHSHKNKIGNREKLNTFHIHRLYDQQLSDGTDTSLDADPTTEYATFDEALYRFLQDCHIEDWEKYFPELEESINQLRLEGV